MALIIRLYDVSHIILLEVLLLIEETAVHFSDRVRTLKNFRRKKKTLEKEV